MGVRLGKNVLPSERRTVAWYSPPVLMQAGGELVSSQDFLRNSDRRELFEGDFHPIDFSKGPDCCNGFDFIADTGDGGNATFTVAEAAQRGTLQARRADDAAGSTAFERPPLVVLGGDLAYPTANSLDYHYRLLEPFELARPLSSDGLPAPVWRDVLAIPQNHDWFDSITTFCRYFVDRSLQADGLLRPTEFVDTYARQKRSYFAALLPHRWWILGLDFALKGDIDRRQFRDFCTLWETERTGPRIEPGDNIILVYPEPYWTRKLSHGAPEGYTMRYQRLEHLLEGSPGPMRETHGAQARIRLRLAGDLHHYCRHSVSGGTHGENERTSTHLVTCGSGGAFMHTTHGAEVQGEKILDRSWAHDTEPASLGRRIRVGLKDSSLGDASKITAFDRTKCYPNVGKSRCLALTGMIFSLFWPNFSRPMPTKLSDFLDQLWDSNLGFAICLGLLYGINAYVNSIAFSRSFALDDFKAIHCYADHGLIRVLGEWVRAMFFSPFAVLVNVVMIAGCVRIAWEGPWGNMARIASGTLHGLVHGVAVFVLYFAAAHAVYGGNCHTVGGVLPSVATWLLVTLGGVFTGSLIFGVYFAVINVFFRQLTNNASSSIAWQDYKGFLRFKFTDQALEATFLACDRVPRKWKLNNEGRIEPDGAQAPWHVEDEFKLPH